MVDRRAVPDRRRLIFLWTSGTAVAAILVAFRAVLVPFVLAILVAFLFAPAVDWIQRIRLAKRSLPRWGAVLVLYVMLFGGLAAIIAAISPRLVHETRRLSSDLPHIAQRVDAEWRPRVRTWLAEARRMFQNARPTETNDAPLDTPNGNGDPTSHDVAAVAMHEPSLRVIPRPDGSFDVVLPPNGIAVTPEGDGYRVNASDGSQDDAAIDALVANALGRAVESGQRNAIAFLDKARAVIQGIARGIFVFFLTMMLSAYLLITSVKIFAFFRSLVRPDEEKLFDDFLRRLDRGLAGVVRGQLVICLVNGVLSGIGFVMFDLPYWPILTLIATMLSIIPIFGAILSSIPAVAIGLQHGGLPTGALVLLWILGIHQVEANLLNPKIMGDAAKVHPVLVVFALLAGEHFFGILGALLAVPVLSILQTIFLHFRMLTLGMPASSTASPDSFPPSSL